MTHVFGAVLVERASEPLRVAGEQLGMQHVEEGLVAIAPDRLLAGLNKGIEEEADRAGVPPSDVKKLLPWEEIEAALARLRESHANALKVWRGHRNQLGGFLTGVTEVTTEDEAPDSGWFLSRLAAKVVRDRSLSRPLDALSADVTRWERIIELSGAALREHGGGLRRARRKKLLKLAFGALVLVSFLFAFLSFAARIGRSRMRLEIVLAASDPCAVLALDPSDIARGSDAQKATIMERRSGCEQNRVLAQRAREEQLAREAAEARCVALASHLEAGIFGPEDATAFPDHIEVLTRVARGALTLRDFALTEAELPCGKSPASPRIWRAVAKAASGSVRTWGEVVHVSDRLVGLLASDVPLGEPAKRTLSARAEGVAKRAVLAGEPALLADAEALCDLTRALGLALGNHCKGALAVTQRR